MNTRSNPSGRAPGRALETRLEPAYLGALAQAMGFPDRRAIPTVGRYGIRNPMTSRIVNFRTVHAAAASRLPGNDQGQMRSRTLPADGARGAGLRI